MYFNKIILEIKKIFNIYLASGGLLLSKDTKVIKKSFLKNFSVILSVCWFTKEYGESLHPILWYSFSIFVSVISKNLTNEKFFGSFEPFFILKKFGSASNSTNTERSVVLSEIAKWAERHFCPLLLLVDKSGSGVWGRSTPNNKTFFLVF